MYKRQVKHSVVPKEMHVAMLNARPFDCEEDAIAAVLSRAIRPGDAVFILSLIHI